MAKTIGIVAMAGVLLLFAGKPSAAGQSSSEKGVVPTLRVGPGDLIEVTIFDNTDLSGHFRVNERGDIVMPLIGPVHVDGETAEEIGKNIDKGYTDAQILPSGKYYATVFISEYATQGITVSGEVKSPGVFPALGVRMLHDVMTAAGGVLVTSSSKVIITRKDDKEHPITVTYNPLALNPVIPEVQIFPGDSILVPRAGVIYVLGNVSRPGAYVLGGRDTVTIEEAIALAGNTGNAASTKSVHLVRSLKAGQKEDVVLALNQILKGKAPDVEMKDGDVLYIPTSGTKLAAERAMAAAIGIGTSVVIYKSAY